MNQIHARVIIHVARLDIPWYCTSCISRIHPVHLRDSAVPVQVSAHPIRQHLRQPGVQVQRIRRRHTVDCLADPVAAAQVGEAVDVAFLRDPHQPVGVIMKGNIHLIRKIQHRITSGSLAQKQTKAGPVGDQLIKGRRGPFFPTML